METRIIRFEFVFSLLKRRGSWILIQLPLFYCVIYKAVIGIMPLVKGFILIPPPSGRGLGGGDS